MRALARGAAQAPGRGLDDGDVLVVSGRQIGLVAVADQPIGALICR